MRLLFLGLDGATWTVLDPLMREGKLPNLARLAHARGKLRTCHPPYTFPAWKVISSGRAPEDLGVFGWITADFAERRFVVPDARTFNTPEMWDYLADEGLRVATVNMPATWPVRPVKNGVMVGDPFARNDATVSPPDARARFGLGPYTTDTPLAFKDSPEKALALVKRLEGERFDISMKLAPHMDVLFHTVFFCDPIQHFHWEDPKTLAAAWTWLDERIGELLDRARPEHVVVASDHGFTEVRHQLNINRWLEEQGLLHLTGAQATPMLYRLGITRERALAAGRAVGLTERRLTKLVPLRLRKAVPNEDGELGVNRLAVVDWHATRALSADGFQVYVRDAGARKAVLEGLQGMTVPGTGEPAFDAVVDAAALSGRLSAPVVLTPRDGVLLAHKFGGELWKRKGFSGGWQATHALDGVLMVSGKGVAPGEVEGARLIDVAPTVLALAGARQPTSMRGRALAGKSRGARETLPPPFV